MYALPFHVIRRSYSLLLALLTLPCPSGGLGRAGTPSSSAGVQRGVSLLASRSARLRRAPLDERTWTSEALRNSSTVSTQYLLHNSDGMTFNYMMAVGTRSAGKRCIGIDHCQFSTFEEAKVFCDNIMACNGIVQDSDETGTGCANGLGCFYPSGGMLLFDGNFLHAKGKTFERQVLAYGHFQDGRKFSETFPVATRKCPGVTYCQFDSLEHATAFCDLDSECLGVLKMPAAVHGADCSGGKGCFAPARGELQHDPLWLSRLGETYLKQQEVAYIERFSDGMVYDGRFPAGTSGCNGVHNCQFKTLATAEAYCDANPTCKGVLQHTVEQNGDPACSGGRGCFEPCRGTLKYNAMFMVTEGKLYERHLVR